MTEEDLRELERDAYQWRKRNMLSNTEWSRRHARDAELAMQRAEMGDEEDD